MARFVDIGRYHINMDHVISITPPTPENDVIWLDLVNGQQIQAPGYMHKVLTGEYVGAYWTNDPIVEE